MEYVLMDIKNFLKKLENGQLEIEAGQWQLHKVLSNLSKTVSELKTLREDVEDLKHNNLQQMGLIRELQMQLGRLHEIQEEERPESSVEYERVYNRPIEDQSTPKGFKKRKCRIRSEEIIEITSQMSNENSEDRHQSVPMVENGATECSNNDNKHNSDEESSGKDCKTESRLMPLQNRAKCQYAAHVVSNDMLQRYLKDSVKYVDKKASNSTEMIQKDCNQGEVEKSHSTDYTTFWDEYSSRAPPDSHCENRNQKVSKEASTATDDHGDNYYSRRIPCPKCPKRVKVYRVDTTRRRGKKYKRDETVFYCKTCGKGFGNRERLRDHEAVHKTSRSFKGFKCSYCTKICSSPEKLTSHLRKCRLIMKSHSKKRCN